MQSRKLHFAHARVKCRLEMGKIFVKQLRHAARNQPWRWPLCFNPMLLCNLTGPWPWGRDDLGLNAIQCFFGKKKKKKTPKVNQFHYLYFWGFSFELNFCLLRCRDNQFCLTFQEPTWIHGWHRPAFKIWTTHRFTQNKSLKKLKDCMSV